MLTGIYQSGTSVLHRAGAGVKLLGLLVFSTLLVAWRSPVTVFVCIGLVVACYRMGEFGVRTLASQAWPLRWIVLLLFPFQWWTAGWQAAIGIVGTLVLAVVGAALISLTTRAPTYWTSSPAYSNQPEPSGSIPTAPLCCSP